MMPVQRKQRALGREPPVKITLRWRFSISAACVNAVYTGG